MSRLRFREETVLKGSSSALSKGDLTFSLGLDNDDGISRLRCKVRPGCPAGKVYPDLNPNIEGSGAVTGRQTSGAVDRYLQFFGLMSSMGLHSGVVKDESFM